MKIVNVAVCNGRHDIPQAMDGAVFKQTISEMNPEKLYNSARKRFVGDYKLTRGDIINLYVTGFTMATLAIVKVCKDLQIEIICYHFDRETGTYIAQVM